MAADPEIRPGGAETRPDPRVKLLDAAERLLTRVGYPEVTTRRLAEEAGVNHGLIHYYFGSMEEVFLQAFERFSGRLIARQRALYGGDAPFIEKWRTAMGLMDADLAAGYPKISSELTAMALNNPKLQERLRAVWDEWWDVLTGPLGEAIEASEIDTDTFPVDAAVAFVFAYTIGTQEQRLIGFDRGHASLRDALDRLVASMEGNGTGGTR